MKILIRATNWIGDAVISLPAIRAVRQCYPRAELCILARPWVAAVYEGEPCINRILLLHVNSSLYVYIKHRNFLQCPDTFNF